MTKYITVKLTEDQAWAIIRDLEYEQVDNSDWQSVAYSTRIINKIRKELAKS